MSPTAEARQIEGSRPILAPTVAAIRASWKRLALADLAYKAVAFVLLTPLVGLLFNVIVAFSGRSFLADEDILFFFLGPVGWICLILIGALSLAILAVEQVALLAIVAAESENRHLSAVDAMRFAAGNTAVALSTLR